MKFKFKENAKIYSDDLYNDLLQGKIDPEELLENVHDIASLCDAINIIDEFITQASDEGILD